MTDELKNKLRKNAVRVVSPVVLTDRRYGGGRMMSYNWVCECGEKYDTMLIEKRLPLKAVVHEICKSCGREYFVEYDIEPKFRIKSKKQVETIRRNPVKAIEHDIARVQEIATKIGLTTKTIINKLEGRKD